MIPITLTYEEAKELLERAVESKGEDYVYEKVPSSDELPFGVCAYFNPETEAPSCIVGHVLAYKGVTYRDAFNGGWNAGINAEDLCSDQGVIECDSETSDLLESAQVMQDEGQPWGSVLRVVLDEEDQ